MSKASLSEYEYVTLQNDFSHPSLVIYFLFFPTPPIKLKLRLKIISVWLQIANHWDQSDKNYFSHPSLVIYFFFFSNPTDKTKIETQNNKCLTTNSKPLGPIRKKLFLTSKFSYLLFFFFCNPTHKTKTETQNNKCLMTTDSKPPVLTNQTETGSRSRIIVITLFSSKC